MMHSVSNESKSQPFTTKTFVTIFPVPVSAKVTHLQNGSEVIISSDELHPCDNLNITSSSAETKGFSNILLSFFKLAYYICFSPFLILKGSDGQFYTKQWWPQQVICAIGTISSIFYRVLEVRMELPNENVEWNPALYFKLFHKILNLVFNLNIWIAMWLMKDKFVAIIQFFCTRMHHESLVVKQHNISRVVVFVGVLNAISVAIYFMFGTDILRISKWSPILLLKCFAVHSKQMSFCVNRHDCEGIDFDHIELSNTDILLAIILSISRFLRKVMGISEELLVLDVPLTLWVTVKDFVENFVTQKSDLESQTSWKSISKRYGDLNDLTDLINRTFGPILLSYTLTALFYFSINLDEFLSAGDTLVQFKFLVFYILIVSTFILSAEIVRQIGKLVPWISNNLNDSLNGISHKELTVILHEISSNRIGISACGLFTVTYSVVAQMTGVFVTYFIIMVQYRETK